MRDQKPLAQGSANYEQQAFVFEPLEPRLLLSADLPIDLGPVFRDDSFDDSPLLDAISQPSKELVLIASDTPNYQSLVEDLFSNATSDRAIQVVLIDASQDGLRQITSVLSAYNDLDAVHLVTHGNEASIALGDSQIRLDTLSQQSGAIKSWANAFSDTGDLLIYGCDLAASAAGQALIDGIANLTGTDVAASDDLTGSALLGGDWELEYQIGRLETATAFSAQLMQTWSGILASPVANDATITIDENTFNNSVIGTVSASDSDPGDTLTYSIIGGNATETFYVHPTIGQLRIQDNSELNFESAESFTQQTGTDNPFDGLDVGTRSKLAIGDIDGDTDLDVFISDYNGNIRMFENTGDLNAPSYTERVGGANPFNGLALGAGGAPSVVDIDGDGDLDLFSGNNTANIRYFENTGNANSANFVERTGAANPLDSVSGLTRSVPSFTDIDADGDYDAFIGEKDGAILYYQNTGTASSPVFIQQTGTSNPFNNVDIGDEAVPYFADLDGDGDLDAAIGDKAGALHYFDNTGTTNSASFVQRSDDANPFNHFNTINNAAPVFADIDADGKPDLFLGREDGTIDHYQLTPSFSLTIKVSDPGGLSDTALITVHINDVNDQPVIEDATLSVDENATLGTSIFTASGSDEDPGDTLTYSIIGGNHNNSFQIDPNSGVISVANNTTLDFESLNLASNPAFTPQTGSDNPFNGIDFGGRSTPTFVDIDGDGDLDAVIGEYDGNVNYYKNIGTAESANFVAVNGAENPFNSISTTYRSVPTFVDIDNDGDQDLFLGRWNGAISYYENTGTRTSANFIAATGADNPFNGLDLSDNTAPTFVDIDGDGDQDAFIGVWNGAVRYFENTGTANNPSMTERTGADNPLSSVSAQVCCVEWTAKPHFADLDADGDYDAFIGLKNGKVDYYENTGTADNPAFTQRSADANPLQTITTNSESAPSFVDIDNDGDLDLFLGDANGQITFFKNAPAFNLTIQVDDNAGLTDTAIIRLTINDVNETPMLTDASYALSEDSIFSNGITIDNLLVNATDPDGDSLSINTTPVVDVQNGVLLLNSNGSFTYTPNENFNGTDSFTYEAIDGKGGSAQASVTLTISAINDAPTLNVPSAQYTLQNAELIFANSDEPAFLIGDVDAGEVQITLFVTDGALSLPNPTGLIFTVGDGENDQKMVFSGSVDAINTALLNLRYVPEPTFHGQTSLRISVNDLGNIGTGNVLSIEKDIDITVYALSPSPVSNSIEATTSSQTSVQESLPQKEISTQPSTEHAKESPPETQDSNAEESNNEEMNAVLTMLQNSQSGASSSAQQHFNYITAHGLSIGTNSESVDSNNEKSQTGFTSPIEHMRSLLALQINAPIWDSIQMMNDQMGDNRTSLSSDEQLLTSTASGLTVTFTVSYLSWLLRSGSLATSLISMLPLWREIDPLPVLASTASLPTSPAQTEPGNNHKSAADKMFENAHNSVANRGQESSP